MHDCLFVFNWELIDNPSKLQETQNYAQNFWESLQ